ncbi:hypothetical protein FRACYDRAFT_188960 [Fragilariopsis cylindrus CCMP1102]|uniref:GPI inositol-deacylase n=1 Tax=Fragilariopsis cylindrus CCMP1102 TaxID=635003 RepID=A0A1E7F7C0_9STRA|nr:hypothetical protein FRACYDRAFT_188960 [Fragilariopsis cylindrus CCMP1102]|eukprot:OEU14046.1 hypothetical protein FRACYDRAFT_188960 [Fragilariopsis cylindrus CCMP1102]
MKSFICWTFSWLVLLLIADNHSAEAFSGVEIRWQRSSRDSSTSLFLSQATIQNTADDAAATTDTSSSSLPERKVAILLCPAQFCVPDDYSELWETLPSHIDVIEDVADSGSSPTTTRRIAIDKDLSRVVPLSRRDWIKVSKQLPTTNFLDATLEVHKTLDWYFDSIEAGLNEILSLSQQKKNNGDNGLDGICFVGHSIGGWVARAYLGGLSRSSTAVSKIVLEDNNMVSSLITLGTPHVSPDTALIDQTRGLLREVAETSACSSDTLVTERGIDVTCLCSSSFSGNFITTNIEEFVAASSYLPLLGKTNDSVKGDGIVPLDLAFMEEPARKIILPECPSTGKPIRHSHVLPTPWNLWDPSAKSIVLDDTDAVSYMSPGVVQQWAQYIR